MPPTSMQYTLVGFSAELDWRPLCFVKPLPPNRLCGACGLVRPKTAFLPCGHTLCESCYEQCAHESFHICPFDGYECQDQDVISMVFPADELLRREVKCWNEENGCRYVTAASGIAQHFLAECGYHSVRCPKCSATALCCGMILHLKSNFCSSLSAPVSECAQQSSLKNETAKQIAEVKQFMLRVMDDISTLGDRLNEISHGINSSKETFKQGLRDGAKQNRESLTQIMSEIKLSNKQIEFLSARIDALDQSGSMKRMEITVKDELATVSSETRDHFSKIATAIETVKACEDENSQKMLDHIKIILRRAELGVAHTVFFLKNVKSLEDTAKKEGWDEYDSEKVYLRGYCMSPGVSLRNESGSVRLHARLQLHQGDMDDAVQWPFEHKIKLSVMHPRRAEELVIVDKPHHSLKYFQRPMASSNPPVYFPAEMLKFETLLSDGYVEDDQLRVKFELVL